MATVTGGALLQKKLELIGRRLGKKGSVTVGFNPEQKYPDGTPLAEVAARNEFGDPGNNQPPRPFIRPAISEYSADWRASMKKALTSTESDVEAALNIVGQEMAEGIARKIEELTEPALAQTTVQRKRSDKPLIDTGFMLEEIRRDGYKVEIS